MKRRTLGESAFPETDDFIALLLDWQGDAISRLFNFVWTGCDTLSLQVLKDIDLSQNPEDLERSLTQYLEPRIHQAMEGFEPFHIQHGPHEHETRKASPAQPPLYDLAFVWFANPRIMLPIEAKLLPTDGSVANYIKDIRNEFLTCRYAPFSSQGAMLGYLLAGTPSRAFETISKKLSCTMHEPDGLSARHHRCSDHRRKVPRGKHYPAKFKLHHLIFEIAPTQ